jgi:hypothetical protein
VHQLILATKHNAAPATLDAALLIDVDLAILGAAPGRFDEYERQVRQEYSWVPGFLVRRKRREILEGFLARPHVYFTDHFRARCEARARANLARSIAQLGWQPFPPSSMTALPSTLIGEFIDAAVRDHERAAALLTGHPELLNARWLHGETVLHFVAVEGFTEGVTFLAGHGADVNAVSDGGHCPLIDVTVLGHTEIAEVLLRHGADPNARSDTRDNVLHCAVASANVRLVALLLAAGADARYRTGLGESVFDAVPVSGPEREEILSLLAERGVTPDSG